MTQDIEDIVVASYGATGDQKDQLAKMENVSFPKCIVAGCHVLSISISTTSTPIIAHLQLIFRSLEQIGTIPFALLYIAFLCTP